MQVGSPGLERIEQIRMRTWAHAHTCVRTRTRAHTHAHALAHARAHIHTHIHTHTHMHTLTLTHRPTHTHTHNKHAHAHAHAHTHTHTHTHIHTNTHTQTHAHTHTLHTHTNNTGSTFGPSSSFMRPRTRCPSCCTACPSAPQTLVGPAHSSLSFLGGQVHSLLLHLTEQLLLKYPLCAAPTLPPHCFTATAAEALFGTSISPAANPWWLYLDASFLEGHMGA